MTLAGAINQGNKKILFADRKWSFSNKFKNHLKIFADSNDNYLLVSGFILRDLIKNFEKGRYSIEDLISTTYKNYDLPGTSFISYNSSSESLNVHFLDKKELKTCPIIHYLFLGCDVKSIRKNFNFNDVEHSLIPALRQHQQKYREYVGNNFDFLIFNNKIPVHMNVNLR